MGKENRLNLLVLVFIVAGLGYLTYQIISPFLSAVVWAVVVSIVSYPLCNAIERLVRKRVLAAGITVLIVLVAILGPLAYLSYVVSQEAVDLVGRIEKSSIDSLANLVKHPAANSAVRQTLRLFHVTEAELQKGIVENAVRLGKESAGIVTSGLGNAVSGAINFIFMLLSVFFFLADGPGFIRIVGTFLPFSERTRERLFERTKDIVISTIYGGVTVAVVQGIIGGVAFWVLGIASPVLWGVVMFMASFIPVLGTFVVWGPAVGYFGFQGIYAKAIALFLVGVIGISSVDNILRPMIIKDKMKMPTIVIFFSILGGIKLFGFIGFIMGPLVVALFVSVFQTFSHGEGVGSEEIVAEAGVDGSG